MGLDKIAVRMPLGLRAALADPVRSWRFVRASSLPGRY
jgi:hypothetical protein